MKTVSVRISGKVQGVFFRASTKEKADELGIKGFVKNERDGSVFIEAQGEEENLNTFLYWCKQGPRLARVDRCEITEAQPRHYTTFEISR